MRKAREHESATAPAEEPRRGRKPGPRPGSEEARRGGLAAREKYGVDYYRRIGARGGYALRDRRGLAFYSEIGRQGGEATRRSRGTEHYVQIGRLGGQRRHKRGEPPAEGATSASAE